MPDAIKNSGLILGNVGRSLLFSKYKYLESDSPVYRVKGTVNVISSDPIFIEWHQRFTSVPFKVFSDQEKENMTYSSSSC